MTCPERRVHVCVALWTQRARRGGADSGVDRARFGRRSFGAVSSVLDPFHKGGLGLGALFAGIAFDFAGNYQAIFMIFCASYLVSTVLIFLAKKPAKKTD